jgi:putative dehydrogenase
MTTNAILLHKYMDFLVAHDFHILVSLDGNKINDSYRVDHNGKNSFDRVTRNVDLVREKYPKFFDKNINFNSVLHNRNSVEDIYSYFKTKYNKKPTISELNNSGIKTDKIQEFNQTYRNSEESLHQSEHYEEIEKDLFIDTSSYKSLLLYLQQYSGFYYRDYTDLLCDRTQLKYIPTGTCLPFSKKMFVTVNGKILPCERIGHQYGLGHLTTTGIELDVVEIARKYNQYYTKMENQCNYCKNKPSCIQCLFNIKDIEKRPICYGFMNETILQQFKFKQYQFLREHPEAYRNIMEKLVII